MSRRKPVTFERAVQAAENLVYKVGLKAIRASEGGGQIVASSSARVQGSVDIDASCKKTHPSDSRWDYVIGYLRDKHCVAYFVEVHPAEASDVSKLEKKLAWLKTFLARPAQRDLSSFQKEYHWVASGRINIPQHSPQYRKLQVTLRAQGLQPPVKRLTME
jgi:hypothetical protein